MDDGELLDIEDHDAVALAYRSRPTLLSRPFRCFDRTDGPDG